MKKFTLLIIALFSAATFAHDPRPAYTAGVQDVPNALPQAQETPDSIIKPKFWISVGAGGFFAGDFGGGIKWDCGEELAMPHSGGGGYIFVDAVYAEIFAGYATSGGSWRSADATDQDDLPNARRAHAHGGLFVKYPFTVNILSFFPLLGAEYEYSHTAKLRYDDANDYVFDGKSGRPAAKLLSAIWVKFGGGADVDMGRRMYMRAELLYGFRRANKYEEERVEAEKTKTGENVKTISGNGLTFKAGIGVKF